MNTFVEIIRVLGGLGVFASLLYPGLFVIVLGGGFAIAEAIENRHKKRKK